MADAYAHAIQLLARREHGAHELALKLAKKGYSTTDVEAAVLKCQKQGLQCDHRYSETLLRHRLRQGYGPLRIKQELQYQQIEPDLIDDLLRSKDIDWVSHASSVREKKYGIGDELPYAILQKQKQFLRYRGFTHEIITALFEVR